MIILSWASEDIIITAILLKLFEILSVNSIPPISGITTSTIAISHCFSDNILIAASAEATSAIT
jgi:hypothetical protein